MSVSGWGQNVANLRQYSNTAPTYNYQTEYAQQPSYVQNVDFRSRFQEWLRRRNDAQQGVNALRTTAFQNKPTGVDAPDPAILRTLDGTYYAYTTQARGANVPVFTSKDLGRWQPVTDAMPVKPAWAKGDIWAPQTMRTGDHYTLFFSARGNDGKMRIGYATSPSPVGPFQDRGVLVQHNNPGYAIDPNIFVDKASGRAFLYWGSANGDASQDVTGIRGQEIQMSSDGTITRVGEEKVVKPKLADDRVLVEAPWVKEHNGKYFMFYSDGHFQGRTKDDEYALKVAVSDSPLGPFTQSRTVLSSNSSFKGPGHTSVVSDDAGNDWAVYHARANGSEARQMMLDRIQWGADGWPIINDGQGPSSNLQYGPSVRSYR